MEPHSNGPLRDASVACFGHIRYPIRQALFLISLRAYGRHKRNIPGAACGCTCAAATVGRRIKKKRHKPGTCRCLVLSTKLIGFSARLSTADQKLPITPGLGIIITYHNV